MAERTPIYTESELRHLTVVSLSKDMAEKLNVGGKAAQASDTAGKGGAQGAGSEKSPDMLALPEGYSPLRLAMAAMKSDDLASGTAVRPEPAPPKAVTIAEIVPNTGVENIAMHMKQKADDMELQIRCASALGHIAYKANHKRHKRGSGQMKTIHFDFDEVPLANIQLQQAGAVSLVIQAVLRYTNNRRCALRCMWALEHLCAVPDAYTTFEAEGGKSLLQTLEAMYRRDPDMMASVTHLKKPPSTGQTSDCSIQ